MVGISVLIAMLALRGAAVTEPVAQWTPPPISSPMWESHPAIDPETGDLWFVRSSPKFEGWKLYSSTCASRRLSTPAPRPIAGKGLEADPWFAPNGRTMWFISTGSDERAASQGLDIYRRTRTKRGRWNEAERLPEPVNSAFAEWFPRLGPDAWLYFGSRRRGGFGKDDIWRARQDSSGHWIVENAGAGLNTPGAEYEFEPAPSGAWGILSTDDGLVRVVHDKSGWRRTGKFEPRINRNGTEIGPLILSDDRSFLFSRDTGRAASGELFIAAPQAPVAPIGAKISACGPSRVR